MTHGLKEGLSGSTGPSLSLPAADLQPQPEPPPTRNHTKPLAVPYNSLFSLTSTATMWNTFQPLLPPGSSHQVSPPSFSQQIYVMPGTLLGLMIVILTALITVYPQTVPWTFLLQHLSPYSTTVCGHICL